MRATVRGGLGVVGVCLAACGGDDGPMLMLYEGNWSGQQLIPAEWTRRISSVVTARGDEPRGPSGRVLRVRLHVVGLGRTPHRRAVRDDAADGAVADDHQEVGDRGVLGQWITVLPAADLVIAHKTDPGDGTTSWESWHRMLELVLTARGVEMPGPWPWGRVRTDRSAPLRGRFVPCYHG